MTEADLEACRAAFPALNWLPTDYHQAKVRLGENLMAYAGPVLRIADSSHTGKWSAYVLLDGHQVAVARGASMAAALAGLRQAMTTIRDDLTAALGEP